MSFTTDLNEFNETVYIFEYNGTIYRETCNIINDNLSFIPVASRPYLCNYKHSLPMMAIIGIILSLLTMGTALGNFLVILAVFLVKKLQTPSNLLIVSLAFSDFFVSIFVMPVATLKALYKYWHLGETICDLTIAADVLLCTASILNLCAISIDRYLVITKPLQYAVKRTPVRMAMMIFLVWFFSAVISIPPIFGWKKPYEEGKCQYSDDIFYQIYATFGAFYLPLIVMLILYGRIFKLARDMSLADKKQKLLSAAAEPVSPLVQADGDIDMDEMPNGGINAHDEEHGHHNRSNAVQKPQGNKQSQGDSKAIKTLGVIMGCFTLCWLPFFIVMIILPLDNMLPWNIDMGILGPVIDVFNWLGYVNSFLNPVIYAKFNRDFRTPFKEILMGHCRSINTRLRSEAYAEQYGLPMNNIKKKGGETARKRTSDVFVNMSKKGRLKTVGNGNNAQAAVPSISC